MDVMVTATLHTHVTKTTHWLEDVGSSRIQSVEYALMAPHFLQTLVLYLPRHSHSPDVDGETHVQVQPA